jgi:ParB family transcriptional regulator, chromosome partitioning protein
VNNMSEQPKNITPKKTGLGRGLNILFADTGGLRDNRPPSEPRIRALTDEPIISSAPAAPPRTLPLEKIIANPHQPRRRFEPEALLDLENSIRKQGMVQPIIVRPAKDRFGWYEIVAGERRWRAAQRIPLHVVPVIVRELNDSEVLELALVENIQRQDLNPIEEADGYQRLIAEFFHTQEALGTLVGKSRAHVANMLRLLELPETVRDHVIEGRLSMGHARALITASDPAGLAEKIIREGLSVRQAEAMAKAARDPSRPGQKAPRVSVPSDKDPDTLALERDLSTAVGMPVTVTHDGAKGTLSIAYTSLDQLDDLCQRLCATPGTRVGF